MAGHPCRPCVRSISTPNGLKAAFRGGNTEHIKIMTEHPHVLRADGHGLKVADRAFSPARGRRDRGAAPPWVIAPRGGVGFKTEFHIEACFCCKAQLRSSERGVSTQTPARDVNSGCNPPFGSGRRDFSPVALSVPESSESASEEGVTPSEALSLAVRHRAPRPRQSTDQSASLECQRGSLTAAGDRVTDGHIILHSASVSATLSPLPFAELPRVQSAPQRFIIQHVFSWTTDQAECGFLFSWIEQ